tara:strand:+ start:749 stop:1189 length:441 start_codon:yes stop_codon:yes gene_type:complete
MNIEMFEITLLDVYFGENIKNHKTILKQHLSQALDLRENNDKEKGWIENICTIGKKRPYGQDYIITIYPGNNKKAQEMYSNLCYPGGIVTLYFNNPDWKQQSKQYYYTIVKYRNQFYRDNEELEYALYTPNVKLKDGIAYWINVET